MKQLLNGLFLILLLSSCGSNDLKKAEASLTGTWNISQIHSTTGERLQNGINVSWDTLEINVIGQFTFDDERKVTFSYTRLNQDYNGTNENWVLSKESINCGFTQCDQYNLTIADMNYICNYGDGTNDSHENATDIVLIYETQEIGDYERFEIQLLK